MKHPCKCKCPYRRAARSERHTPRMAASAADSTLHVNRSSGDGVDPPEAEFVDLSEAVSEAMRPSLQSGEGWAVVVASANN